MERNQAWRCRSLIAIGYIVGNENERKEVATQLHECVVRLDHALGREVTDKVRRKCQEVVEMRIFSRLSNADENYGVVGCKRWKPIVKAMTLTPIGREEETEEAGE